MWTWDTVIWWFRVMGLWAVFLYFQNYFFYGCHDLIVQKLVEEKMDFFVLACSCSLLKAL